MNRKCSHCFVWQKKYNQLVSACNYCGYTLIEFGEFQDSHEKMVTESLKNYNYIHKKYGCVGKPWNYDAMKQKAYNKLAHL
jgi:hypothetical protein